MQSPATTSVGRWTYGIAIANVLTLGILSGAAASEDPPRQKPAAESAASLPNLDRVPRADVELPPPQPPAAPPIQAVPQLEGVPAVGLRMTLNAKSSRGENLAYRWIQTQGTPVTIDRPSAPVAHFTVPGGAGTLCFLLVVGNPSGMDVCGVSVAIRGDASNAGSDLRADAGDDQAVAVGRQVTLNGIRSEPRQGLAYRWIQLAGPTVRLKIEDRYIYTFTPVEAGLYRFALLVAVDGAISDPDIVDVTVTGPPGAPTPAPVGKTTRELVAGALHSLERGTATAGELASIYQQVALRMDLYESYAVLLEELSRNLDRSIPEDPVSRAAWNERLFQPLTSRLVERMRVEGLDLTAPAALTTPLSDPQKRELASLFQSVAEACQTVKDGK
jgi:hypothetical protein